MTNPYATANPYAPPRAAVRDIPDRTGTVQAADRGTRLGAAILDSIIFMVMVYVPVIMGIVIVPGVAGVSDDAESAFGAVMLVAGAVALAGLVAWLWLTIKFMARNGQSIAKKLLGIKVVRSDGSPASLGRLIWLRNVITWALSLLPFYGLVDILFIFGESRQCLHDKIADTIVVQA